MSSSILCSVGICVTRLKSIHNNESVDVWIRMVVIKIFFTDNFCS